MTFCKIAFGTAPYRDCLALRERVLRRPLGKRLSASDTDAEDSQLHFALREQDEVAACLAIKPLGATGRAQLRQMAVAPERQGQSLGRILVAQTEEALREQGFRQLELHARSEATGFYQKLGFQEQGEAFVHIGLEHILMRKRI